MNNSEYQKAYRKQHPEKVRALRAKTDARNRERNATRTDYPVEKRCCRCAQTKPGTDFPKWVCGFDGLRSYCRPCSHAMRKEHFERNPRAMKKYNLKKYFGLSLEQFDAMMIRQNGLCAVCREEKKLYVDHCHKTQVVRGLLCNNCNLLLGHAQEERTRLEAAIRYLDNC